MFEKRLPLVHLKTFSYPVNIKRSLNVSRWLIHERLNSRIPKRFMNVRAQYCYERLAVGCVKRVLNVKRSSRLHIPILRIYIQVWV